MDPKLTRILIGALALFTDIFKLLPGPKIDPPAT
jgi:hypothetical protein